MSSPAINRRMWAACILLGLAAAALIPLYRYTIFEDGISYLSIAQSYAQGDIAHALNGFWSPLYSWLLIVPLWLGIEPLTAMQTLVPPICVLAIGASWKLAKNLGINGLPRTLLAAGLSPILLYFGFCVTTPDFLATAILLLYLALVTGQEPFQSPRRAIGIGLLGAAAYLAKTYALWFFLPHVLIAAVSEIRGRREFRPRTLAGLGITLGACALAIAPWVAAISHKYGYFTLGNAGAYNIAFDGPESKGDPIRNGGLFPLPNPAAISAWEDPTYFPPPHWNPLANWANVQYLIGLIWRNLGQLALVIQWAAPIAVIAIIAALALPFVAQPKSERRAAWVVAWAMILYPWGYLLTHVLLRFVSFDVILLLLLSVRAVQQWAARRATLLVTLLCIGFAWDPAQKLYEIRRQGFSDWQEAAELNVIPAGSAVASDGLWDMTLKHCFPRHLHYYGTVDAEWNPAVLRQELGKFGIDYLIVYQTGRQFPLEQSWRRMNPGMRGVLIYRVP